MSGWEKPIGLADMNGTVITVSYSEEDLQEELGAMAMIEVKTGGARMTAFPTATSLRQVAAAMLDAADQMEDAA